MLARRLHHAPLLLMGGWLTAETDGHGADLPDPLHGLLAPLRGSQHKFRQSGPLRLEHVELETPESQSSLMKLLNGSWVNQKHENHVRGCLELASNQGKDVVDHQFFYDRREDLCGGRSCDAYISYVAVRKADVLQRSAVKDMSSQDVYDFVDNMGYGWFSDYKRYASKFRLHGVDGSLLVELSDADFQDFGVDNALHRRRLQSEIRRLRQGHSYQTFHVLICSVGFSCSRDTAARSKTEVEQLLREELRCVCNRSCVMEPGKGVLELDLRALKDTTSLPVGTKKGGAIHDAQAVLAVEDSRQKVSAARALVAARGGGKPPATAAADLLSLPAATEGRMGGLSASEVNRPDESRPPAPTDAESLSSTAIGGKGACFLAEPIGPTSTGAVSSVACVKGQDNNGIAAPAPDGPSQRPHWTIGEKVTFYAWGCAKQPVEAAVTCVHENGRWVRVQYTDACGGRESTPWVKEGPRLQRSTFPPAGSWPSKGARQL